MYYPWIAMKSLESALRRILDARDGERPIHAFLKVNPEVLEAEVSGFGFCYACIPEFEMGADFRADFLLLRPDSLGWRATLVELKSPDVGLFTRRGSPSRSLCDARRQVMEWSDWVRRNESYLRERLCRVIDCASPAKKREFSRNFRASGVLDIVNPHSNLLVDYAILIGRSSKLADSQLSRLAQERVFYSRVQVMTYDRLIRHAEILGNRWRRA